MRMSKRIIFIDKNNRQTNFPLSIAEIDIPEDLKNLDHVGGFYNIEAIEDDEIEIEGKVYKIKKGQKYIGVFFGQFGYHVKKKGNYWHSSRNKIFRAAFQRNKPIFKYTIFRLCRDGETMNQIYNEENKILKKNQAASSDMYWNSSNGFKQYDAPDTDRIIKVAGLIRKAIKNYMEGKPLGVDGMYIKNYPLNTIVPNGKNKTQPKEKFITNQVKDEIDAQDVEDIRDRIDDYGMEKVEPTVAWENAECLDEHWTCNGHTTLKALKRAKNVMWEKDSKAVLMVTKDVYGDLTKDDCKSVNGILNASQEENNRVGARTNYKTGAKKLVDLYINNKWTGNIKSYSNVYNPLLKAFNLSSNDKEKSIKLAINDIEDIKKGKRNANSTKIDWSLNEEQENIQKFIETLYTNYPKNESIFLVIPTKAMNGNFNKILDAIENAKESKRLTLVDNYNKKGKISKKEPKVWKYEKDLNLHPKNIENIVILPDFRKDETAKQHFLEGKYNIKLGQIKGPGDWVNFKNRLIGGGLLKSFQEFQNKPDTPFKDIKTLNQKNIVSVPLPEYRDDTDV